MYITRKRDACGIQNGGPGCKNDKLSDDTFAVAFEKKCVGANIDAVVFNKYGKVIIEGTTDNQEIFQLLWRQACRRIRQTTTT